MIDAHAHLTDRRFAADVGAVLERARKVGIARILTAAEDVESSVRALALAREHHEIRVAVGVHPHRATSWTDATAERLAELARDERVVAVGEIGLDFSGRSAPPEEQERAFRAQLALASALRLPVVVHVRDSGRRTRELLAGAIWRGMLHCYSEGGVEVPEWTALGLHLSFAGTLTYPGNQALREAARAVPAERLLAETDAPYLAPQNVRGQRNEPRYVAATYAMLAHEREAEFASLVARIDENARELFGERWGT